MNSPHTQAAQRPGMESVPCDLCRADDAEPVLRQRDLLLGTTDEEFTIVRCRRCGLLYLNPRPSMDLIGSYYPTEYYPPVQKKTRSQLEEKAKRFSRRVKRWVLEDYYGYPPSDSSGRGRTLRRILLWPDKFLRELKGRRPIPWRGQGKVLDVGCSTGGNLRTLRDQGWDPYGIEISEVAAAHARELVTENIHTGTLESAPFPPLSFDVVFMSHSLEHLPSPVDALRRIHRLLKDDGLLIVTVPNERSLGRAIFGRWWFNWDPPRHLYHFGRRTLSLVMEEAGFRPVCFRTGVGSPFFMASAERVWKVRFHRELPLRKMIDRLLAKPLCFLAGHAGYGTEMTVYATKKAVG